MSGLDKKTMMHVGAEVVIIGGVVYWTKQKVQGLENKLEEQNKKIEELTAALQQHESVLRQHEHVLQRMFGGHGQLPQQQQPQSPLEQPVPDEVDDEEDDIDSILNDELAQLNQPEFIEVETIETKDKVLSPVKSKKKLKKSVGV